MKQLHFSPVFFFLHELIFKGVPFMPSNHALEFISISIVSNTHHFLIHTVFVCLCLLASQRRTYSILSHLRVKHVWLWTLEQWCKSTLLNYNVEVFLYFTGVFPIFSTFTSTSLHYEANIVLLLHYS